MSNALFPLCFPVLEISTHDYGPHNDRLVAKMQNGLTEAYRTNANEPINNYSLEIAGKFRAQNNMSAKNIGQSEYPIEISFFRENDCRWFDDTSLCSRPSSAHPISNNTHGHRTGNAYTDNNQRKQTKDYFTSIEKRRKMLHQSQWNVCNVILLSMVPVILTYDVVLTSWSLIGFDAVFYPFLYCITCGHTLFQYWKRRSHDVQQFPIHCDIRNVLTVYVILFDDHSM